MARVAMLVSCWLVLVWFPAVGAWKLSKDGVISFAIRAWCIPRTELLLLEHEDRHECIHSLRNGDRAVGMGYNLDDEKDTQRFELSTVLADYDKVYKGLQCLNTVQISALLALDTRRALDRAAKSVKALDTQCCSVMAVFGDIQHSSGLKQGSAIIASKEVESLQASVDYEGLGGQGVGRSLQVLGSDVELGAARAWIGVGGSLGFWFWLLGRLQDAGQGGGRHGVLRTGAAKGEKWAGFS